MPDRRQDATIGEDAAPFPMIALRTRSVWSTTARRFIVTFPLGRAAGERETRPAARAVHIVFVARLERAMQGGVEVHLGHVFLR